MIELIIFLWVIGYLVTIGKLNSAWIVFNMMVIPIHPDRVSASTRIIICLVLAPILWPYYLGRI